MKKYNPQEIEPKWQKIWEKSNLYKADDKSSKDKYYVLVEFPYPSGDGLHTGHVRSYTAQDIIARRLRMMGKNVLYPMGWDAFGLPTENYAIKHKVRPQDATKKNIATFKRQMKALGFSFDWSREINTTDPEYYKWTQWIFLQLLKNNLAYQAKIAINWCPKCKTGLANEEVINGKHERCGTQVEKKLLNQWLLKITKYADRLIKDLKSVNYLESIASQQINWIGKSVGAQINFAIDGSESKLAVFTTRADTIFGATFMVVAPEHPIVEQITKDSERKKVQAYVKKAASVSNIERLEQKEKTGVFSGSYAVNPATKENIPIWIADYVLMDYGTGAIMCVPAHDERDFEFAKKFGLPIKVVIEPETGNPQQNPEFRRSIVALVRNPKNNKYLSINWGKQGGNIFIGGGVEENEDIVEAATREIIEETGYTELEFIDKTENIHHNYFAHSKGVARKIIATGLLFDLKSNKQIEQKLEEDEKNKFELQWLSESEVENLVKDELHTLVFAKLINNAIYAGNGKLVNSEEYSGLDTEEAKQKITADLEKQGIVKKQIQYKLRDWIFSRQHYWGEPIPVIHCQQCGVVAVPEKELPVKLPDVEAYEPTETGESPLAAITEWVNTKCPQCGGSARRETDTMPNWAGSSWYYLRYIDPSNNKVFADADKLKYWLMVDLYNGGMEHTTLHLLYSRFWHKFLYDQKLVPTKEPYAKRRSHGMILGPDGNKMSKSLGNVVNPDESIEKYGADALRMYEMFMGPYDQQIAWSDDKLAGMSRFLSRVWTLVEQLSNVDKLKIEATAEDEVFETQIDSRIHKTLKKIDEDIEKRQFNTVISALMELVNFLNEPNNIKKLVSSNFSALAKRNLKYLALMFAPLAPHIAEEMWQCAGGVDSVHIQSWPKYNPSLVKDDVVTIVVQVNGKLKGEFVAEAGLTDQKIKELALSENDSNNYTKNAEVKKIIVVKNRLVNFVV